MHYAKVGGWFTAVPLMSVVRNVSHVHSYWRPGDNVYPKALAENYTIGRPLGAGQSAKVFGPKKMLSNDCGTGGFKAR